MVLFGDATVQQWIDTTHERPSTPNLLETHLNGLLSPGHGLACRVQDPSANRPREVHWASDV